MMFPKSPIHALLLGCTLILTPAVLTTACGKVSPDAKAGAAGASPSPTLSTRADTGSTSGSSSAPGGSTPGSSTPGSSTPGSSPAKENYHPLEIPAGTRVSVRLQSAISSANAQPGDRFHAVLDSPLGVAGQTVAPAGADVTGKVVAASHSGRLEHPGMLQLELSSIQVRGREVAIHTSTVTARGASHKKRNLGWIGGGAGGGALLGGLLGGGKGALIGAGAGAGAGTVTAAATGKHDVAFNVEHQLTFQLRQQVEIR